jgi:formate hydrogenlyase subunit 6/NADH:ubiquinone oxidoreductase subunit I
MMNDILNPLTLLGNLFEKKQTIEYPKVKSSTAKGYRGFHTNTLDTCIGCANCQDVCMNEAIDMVRIAEDRNPKNKSGCIPRIDYGRCCWCSLCTDVCPPNSLKLDEEYIYVSSDPNSFLYEPKDK